MKTAMAAAGLPVGDPRAPFAPLAGNEVALITDLAAAFRPAA